MNQVYEADAYYRFSPFVKNWIAAGEVMAYCERNKCFWVLYALASYIPMLAKKKGVDYFLIITVDVNPDQTAVFTIKQKGHDDDYRVLVRQKIDYTDLKDNLKFWAINESPGQYDPSARTIVILPEGY